MIEELSDERISWLNELFTEQDFVDAGIDPTSKDIELWTSSRRWQIANLCTYATGGEPVYGPSRDARFIV